MAKKEMLEPAIGVIGGSGLYEIEGLEWRGSKSMRCARRLAIPPTC